MKALIFFRSSNLKFPSTLVDARQLSTKLSPSQAGQLDGTRPESATQVNPIGCLRCQEFDGQVMSLPICHKWCVSISSLYTMCARKVAGTQKCSTLTFQPLTPFSPPVTQYTCLTPSVTALAILLASVPNLNATCFVSPYSVRFASLCVCLIGAQPKETMVRLSSIDSQASTGQGLNLQVYSR